MLPRMGATYQLSASRPRATTGSSQKRAPWEGVGGGVRVRGRGTGRDTGTGTGTGTRRGTGRGKGRAARAASEGTKISTGWRCCRGRESCSSAS